MEEDHGYWGRPEDMGAAGLRRPAFVINATHPGSDLAAQAAAALAAVSNVSGTKAQICTETTDNGNGSLQWVLGSINEWLPSNSSYTVSIRQDAVTVVACGSHTGQVIAACMQFLQLCH